MDLTELDAVGGFFALRTDPSGGKGAPLARLYAGETAPLTSRIDTVAARLGTAERRVAASVAHLGLAARLWSIALGSAALHGEIPDLDPARLHWAPERSAPDDLWLTGSGSLSATAVTLREAVQYGISSPSPTRCVRTRPSPGSCCGETPVRHSPEPCACSPTGPAAAAGPLSANGPPPSPPSC